MKILDRYLIGEYLKLFLLVMASIVSIYLIIDFFGKIRMFISNDATVAQMAGHFFYMIPTIVSQITPAVILLATLMTFGAMSRHNEIVAVKANGVSLYRLSLPVVFICLAVSVILFFFSELIAPRSFHRAEYIRLVEVQKQEALGIFKQHEIWRRGGNAIYNVRMFDGKDNSLHGVTIHCLDSSFRLARRIDAEKARWRDGKWIFENVLIVSQPPGGGFPNLERHAVLAIDMPEKPDDFRQAQKEADKMGFFELYPYVRKLEREGYDATRYRVDLQGKLAFSVVSLILLAIGVSFSLRSERSGGTAQSIGAGVIIGFSYWLVFAFSLSLGRSGSLPPALAAWLPNLLFGGAAYWLIRRVNT
ncbi:MAG: LPS export ABC transporter permease LptG [Pseudomonadota bacterium]|nr:LPS export ABC transporter permease LptG [Pseudomonadota bacterium]